MTQQTSEWNSVKVNIPDAKQQLYLAKRTLTDEVTSHATLHKYQAFKYITWNAMCSRPRLRNQLVIFSKTMKVITISELEAVHLAPVEIIPYNRPVANKKF